MTQICVLIILEYIRNAAVMPAGFFTALYDDLDVPRNLYSFPIVQSVVQ